MFSVIFCIFAKNKCDYYANNYFWFSNIPFCGCAFREHNGTYVFFYKEQPSYNDFVLAGIQSCIPQKKM